MGSLKTENIKFLIQKPKTPPVKPPMHRSMFLESVRRSFNANKECHRTMGYSEIKVDPQHFLKKNSRKVIRPFVEKTVKPKCEVKTTRRLKYDYGVDNARKQIAAAAEKTKTKKNFVRLNIIDAIRKVPPLPKHRSQDTRNGHVIVLDEAGLEPIHVMKKSYGKIPAYLKKKHRNAEAVRQVEEERIRTKKQPLRLVSDDERNELLRGLQTNWASLYKEYLGLPMIIDTLRQLKTKTSMEKQLTQLESDIAMLNKYKSVYVDSCS